VGDFIDATCDQGFEGVTAKRRDGKYEPGKRPDGCQKMQALRRDNFELGGYTPGAVIRQGRSRNFDGTLVGSYEGRS
jgi:bifunctional non-homologous end joining protein LigD